MRIDRIEISNFRKYAAQSFDLNKQFTLFIGDNGAGKTTTLDALAVALGIWLVDVPDSRIVGRNIYPNEIRLEPEAKPERIQFVERKPVSITARGDIAGLKDQQWARQIREDGKRTTNAESKEVRAAISELYRRDATGEMVIFPVIAYYGAGRAWLPSNAPGGTVKEGPARRWNAFYGCLDERIRFADLNEWFKREAIMAGSEGGLRTGFHAVNQAVMNCFPGLERVRFDADRDGVVLTLNGHDCPLTLLSDGQRMMFALVADIAIKAVTQNAGLLVKGLKEASPDKFWPTRDTPGVVLIDELDVHLHPKWQRRVASDLKATFPNIQFVCTSHSPQVIGEVHSDEIRILDDNAHTPSVAYGADANWILDHVQNGSSRNDQAKALIYQAEAAMEKDDLTAARNSLDKLRALMKGEDGELIRLTSSLETLEALSRADD